MAVKGKRANESAPNPRTRSKKSKEDSTDNANVVDGDFGSKTIGDFSPESDGNNPEGDANPGIGQENAAEGQENAENDGFTSDPHHNPNILPGSPLEFDNRTDEEKIRDAANDPNIGQLSDEDKAKIIKVPRTPKLPTMESAGDPELEAMAIEHEDIENTIKTMNKRKNTLKDQMLNKMKKANLDRYSHDGFIIEREEKGETVKVKSVKVAEDE